ncbi:MAG: preprotein translocase subunit YajC [Ignavibacteria bacterium]|nr:preprotein translocase subunit YajC [Ignavibacteria bacterium]
MVHYLLAMAPQQDPNGGSGSMISTLVMFGAIFAIFYFMIIRPQQKRQKEHKDMLSKLDKGTKVVTNSGIHGSIHKVDDEKGTIELVIADGVKVTFEKASIAAVVEEKKAN